MWNYRQYLLSKLQIMKVTNCGIPLLTANVNYSDDYRKNLYSTYKLLEIYVGNAILCRNRKKNTAVKIVNDMVMYSMIWYLYDYTWVKFTFNYFFRIKYGCRVAICVPLLMTLWFFFLLVYGRKCYNLRKIYLSFLNGPFET